MPLNVIARAATAINRCPLRPTATARLRALFLSFEERKELAVAFFFQFLDRDETKGGGIDAVGQTARAGAVVEKVAEMRITFRATQFGAFHSQSAVRFFDNIFFRDWFGETGPAAAAVELIQGSKKRFTGDDIDVNPGRVIVPISVIEWRLGPALLRNVILLGRQLLFQFFAFGCRGGRAAY